MCSRIEAIRSSTSRRRLQDPGTRLQECQRQPAVRTPRGDPPRYRAPGSRHGSGTQPVVHVEHDCIPGPDRPIAEALEDEPDVSGIEANSRIQATAASVAVTPWYAQSIKHCSISTTSMRSTVLAKIAATV